SHFDFIYAPNAELRAKHTAADGAAVRAVLTNGTTGLTAAEIDAMPALEVACALGVGFENIDVAYCKSRGIAVANGAGTNDDCVADHAMALLLASVRRVPQSDEAVRQGIWRNALPVLSNVSGKKMGILGLGQIGNKIARRAVGFDIEIGYHNRKPRPESPYRYFESLIDMAQWCDYLVAVAPGGASTHHLIGAAVLAALGPKGYVVNVGRGSVIDTAALADALRAGSLGGAGLDVYEGEPKPPQVLFEFDYVVMTPHVAGSSPEAIEASVVLFIDNAHRHLDGRALATPVPD
ncbi:MAG: hydroxyacid dehydrogenase, partial [Rhizobacter sp.]|nr:hydroxyacid dehydrogenase [Rhizobacter sp.]